MSSQKRIDASRANGKLSRGPVTEAGKANSARNRTLHDFLCNTAVLQGEDKKEFIRVLAAELAEFEPENHVQLQMVQSLAMLNWRKMRIWAIQHAALAGEIRNQEPNPPDLLDRDMAYRAYAAYKQMHPDRHCIQILHRYEVSCQHQYQAIRRDLLAAKARGAISIRT